MTMKNLFVRCVTLIISALCSMQLSALERVPLSQVQLLDSPFLHAQNTNTNYLLALDTEKLLAPFRREAGLPFKETYGNWESSGLDGHIGGHYLSALSLMYASTGDAKVLEKLNYVIKELKKAQDANGDGYLSGIPKGEEAWREIAEGDIRADNFATNERWVPWYNIHKTYAGLRDAYVYAGNETAKTMLVKLSDWSLKLIEDHSEEQLQNMLRTEHGGMNEIFVDVAQITGDKKYLKLAEQFSHQAILNPLRAHKDELTGLHANTQIPKVIGFKRFGDATKNNDWQDAAEFFWNTVVNKRSVAIGGNSVKEHFHNRDDLSPMVEDIEGPETCNTYNMLRLSEMLFLTDPQTKYVDYYERALYNHILSSQHPDTGGFVYFTPMRPNHYRVYSQVHDGMWCCVGSGLESHSKYGEFIYARDLSSKKIPQVYVNLFIPSRLNWAEQGIVLEQKNLFPDVQSTRIRIDSDKRFALHIRYPGWVEKGKLVVKVNGKKVRVKHKPGSYIALERNWKTGDLIDVELPMQMHLEQMPGGENYYAALYGPIVLAAKTQPFANETLQYFADDSRMGHIAQGNMCPLENAPIFVTDKKDFLQKIKPVANRPLTFSVPVVEGEKEKKMELIPFFRLHDSRYMLYWPMTSRAELGALQEATAEQEKAQLALAARTIDQLTPGQQQPESDHFLKFEDSDMGIHLGRHWRHAKGWFSYVMNDKKHEAKALQVTFFSGDTGRKFSVLVNGKTIADVELKAREGDQFYQVEYPIPTSIVEAAKDGKLVVKFVAKKGSIAGGIYDLRLLRKPGE